MHNCCISQKFCLDLMLDSSGVTFGYGVAYRLGLVFCIVNLDIEDPDFHKRAHGMPCSLQHSAVAILGCFP